MVCATALNSKTHEVYHMQLHKLPVISLFELLGVTGRMNDLYVCSNGCLAPRKVFSTELSELLLLILCVDTSQKSLAS